MATIIDGSLAPRGEKKSFPNGMKWEQSNITDKSICDVYYANGLWVACGPSTLWYSADGKTWTQGGGFTTYTGGDTVRYANGIWVSSGSSGVGYSTDGKVWSQSSIKADSATYAALCYANGLWVVASRAVLSSNLKGVWWSSDGRSWEKSNLTSGFNTVYNYNGVWVLGSSSFQTSYSSSTNYSNGLYYSTDGKNWTQSNIRSGVFNVVYGANGIWVAGSNSKGLYYSTDAKSWTQSNITSNSFTSIYSANGLWVAGSSSSGFYYSTNGKTWAQSNITDGNFRAIYNKNGVWVAESSNDGLYYSIDGKVWTQSNITSGSTTASIYNDNGMWVATTGQGLCYSPTWEVSTPPRSLITTDVAWDEFDDSWKSSNNPVFLTYTDVNGANKTTGASNTTYEAAANSTITVYLFARQYYAYPQLIGDYENFTWLINPTDENERNAQFTFTVPNGKSVTIKGNIVLSRSQMTNLPT